MACIIKPRTSRSKGVISLTSQERDLLVYRFDDIRDTLERVKDNYLVGLHHNWHDYALKYDKIFDFHLAGEDDLHEVTGTTIPIVPMDACNFVPECFYQGSNSEKFWDILFVARAVKFKGIPEFLSAIRKLYDGGMQLRVLFICPLPTEDGDGSLRDVRKRYDAMFNDLEQEKFTLLTVDFRYPFPFDLPTLAYFYRASRIFVHSAPDERRCRVAAYAWACGLPVVGMAPVGSILPKETRTAPYFYEIASYEEFPERILTALNAATGSSDFSKAQASVCIAKSVPLFENRLRAIYSRSGLGAPCEGGWTQGLDVRLGRHHGLPAGRNRLDQDIGGFLSFILSAGASDFEGIIGKDDPEIEIAKRLPREPRPLQKVRSGKLVRRYARLLPRALLRKIVRS